MPNLYQVQGCKISGTEIMRVRKQQNFESIIFNLAQGSGDTLNLSVDAVDSADKPLPGISVIIDSYNSSPVRLSNEYISRPVYITSSMIDTLLSTKFLGIKLDLEITSMELFGKKHRYDDDDYPNDKGKEFVGFKVKIRRKRK